MHLSDWTQPDEKHVPCPKKDTQTHYHLPSSNQGNPEDRGLRARLNNSVEKAKNNAGSSYRNTSVGTKKNLENYSMPMEQITERES